MQGPTFVLFQIRAFKTAGTAEGRRDRELYRLGDYVSDDACLRYRMAGDGCCVPTCRVPTDAAVVARPPAVG